MDSLGKTCQGFNAYEEGKATAIVKGLKPGKYYSYRLHVAFDPSQLYTVQFEEPKKKGDWLKRYVCKW